MEYGILEIQDLKVNEKPIIIWGIKTAARMCYRLLKKMNINIAAIGDNNIQNTGKKLYDIPVLPLQEILSLYPNALIIIGSFFCTVSESIILQLQTANKQFSFCRFEQIEYLYELEYLDRKIKDKNKLFDIINNVGYDENEVWKRKINRGVLTEYRYVMHDNKADYLKKNLSNIYGVKNLILIVSKNYLNELEQLIDELEEFDNIGHIIIALDLKNPIEKNLLVPLASKIFYVICDQAVSEKALGDLEKIGFSIMVNNIPDEVFFPRADQVKTAVTEKMIVESVISYTGHEKNSGECLVKLKSDPVYIVQLFNGLANQALMYLFGRFVEQESNRTVIYDDTILSLDITDEKENVRRIHRWSKVMTLKEAEIGVEETRKRNSFYHFNRAEIAEVFDIPIRLLSDYFEDEIWDLYLEKIKREHSYKYAQSFPLCNALLENGIDTGIVMDGLLPGDFLAVNNCYRIDTYVWGKSYKRDSVMDFLFHNDENMYFMGGWANGRAEDWLVHNRKWVRSQLSFRPDLDEKNKMYAEIIKCSDGVMVHVRRGDFAYFNADAGMEYFNQAIQLTMSLSEYENKKYFVFSDDIEWCQMHKGELGFDKIEDEVIFVFGNEGKGSYIDMYLISLGKVIIPTPGSTFSYVAMLASDTVEKCINMPKYYYVLERGLPPVVEITKVDQTDQ